MSSFSHIRIKEKENIMQVEERMFQRKGKNLGEGVKVGGEMVGGTKER